MLKSSCLLFFLISYNIIFSAIDRLYSLQEIEFGVKQIVKVCFMDLMYNIDLEGEHIKSCNMQQFYFFPNGQKYAIMI